MEEEKKYFRYPILFMCCFILIIISGCGVEFKYQTYRVKEFLYNNPNIKLRIDGSAVLNKYSSYSALNYCGKVLTLIEEDIEYEILVNSSFQKIGDTNYWAKVAGTETLIPVPNFLVFQIRE